MLAPTIDEGDNETSTLRTDSELRSSAANPSSNPDAINNMQRALLHNKKMAKAFDSFQIRADEAEGAKIAQKNRSSMREVLDASERHSQDNSFVGN